MADLNGFDANQVEPSVAFEPVPAGKYEVDRGRIASAVDSDDGRFVVLSVRVDIPAQSKLELNVGPQVR